MSLSRRFGAIKSVAVDSTEEDTDLEEEDLLKTLFHRQKFKFSIPDTFSFTQVRTDSSALESCDDESDDLESCDPDWLQDFKSILSENKKPGTGNTEHDTTTGRTSPMFQKISHESPDLPLQSLKNTLNKYAGLDSENKQEAVECHSVQCSVGDEKSSRNSESQCEREARSDVEVQVTQSATEPDIAKRAEKIKAKRVKIEPEAINEMSDGPIEDNNLEIRERSVSNSEDSFAALPIVNPSDKLLVTKIKVESEDNLNETSSCVDKDARYDDNDATCAYKNIEGIAESGSVGKEDGSSTKMIESAMKGDTKVLIDNPDIVVKSEKIAIENSKEPASKEHRNKDTRKHKVLTISEAKSFPLDDLLPVKKRKLSGDLLASDKQTNPAKTSETVSEATVYESYYTSASDHYSQTVINGSHHDYEGGSIFHGTVYDTETQYETSGWPHSYPASYPTSNMEELMLHNDESIGRQTDNIEQTLFTSPQQTNLIPVVCENNLWTDPFRNMLSQQTATELQDFASRLNIATYLSSDIKVNLNTASVDMEGDKANVLKLGEDVPNCEGDDSSAAGTEKLSDLIDKLQYCISVVESKTDREELVCLIDVLKRETGNETVSSGLPQPGSGRHESDSDNPSGVSSVHLPANHPSNSPSRSPTDGTLNEFEGRTMLKGGVKPRHIPKTTIRKLDRANPKDPRPFHKVRANCALKLPMFMREVWGDDKVDKILAYNWGEPFERKGKLELYYIPKEAKQERFYNPLKEMNKTKQRTQEVSSTNINECNDKVRDPRIYGTFDNLQSQSGGKDPRIYGNINEQRAAVTLLTEQSPYKYCCNAETEKCNLPSAICYSDGGCRWSTAVCGTNRQICEQVSDEENISEVSVETRPQSNIGIPKLVNSCNQPIPVVISNKVFKQEDKPTPIQQSSSNHPISALVPEARPETKFVPREQQRCHGNLTMIQLLTGAHVTSHPTVLSEQLRSIQEIRDVALHQDKIIIDKRERHKSSDRKEKYFDHGFPNEMSSDYGLNNKMSSDFGRNNHTFSDQTHNKQTSSDKQMSSDHGHSQVFSDHDHDNKKSSDKVSRREWKMYASEIEQQERRVQNVLAAYDEDFEQHETTEHAINERDSTENKPRTMESSGPRSRHYRAKDRSRSSERDCQESDLHGETSSGRKQADVSRDRSCQNSTRSSYSPGKGRQSGERFDRRSGDRTDTKSGDRIERRSGESINKFSIERLNGRSAERNERQSCERIERPSERIERRDDRTAKRIERRSGNSVNKSSGQRIEGRLGGRIERSGEWMDRRSCDRNDRKSGDRFDERIDRRSSERTDRGRVPVRKDQESEYAGFDVKARGRMVDVVKVEDQYKTAISLDTSVLSGIHNTSSNGNVAPSEPRKSDLRQLLSRPNIHAGQNKLQTTQYEADALSRQTFKEVSLSKENLSDVTDDENEEEYALEFQEIYGSKMKSLGTGVDGRYSTHQSEIPSMTKQRAILENTNQKVKSVISKVAVGTDSEKMFLNTFMEVPSSRQSSVNVKGTTKTAKDKDKIFLESLKRKEADSKSTVLKSSWNNIKLPVNESKIDSETLNHTAKTSISTSFKPKNIAKPELLDDKAFLTTLRHKVLRKKAAVVKSKDVERTGISDDKAFLASLKEKLTGKRQVADAPTPAAELETKKITDLDCELKDRAFLKMCKKKMEEKTKQMTSGTTVKK